MIVDSRARSILALLVCLAAMLDPAVSRAQNAAHLTRQQLIGTWRLVSIDCSGPKGPIPDPFYQPDSIGIIIYDSTGWMSVAHRRAAPPGMEGSRFAARPPPPRRMPG